MHNKIDVVILSLAERLNAQNIVPKIIAGEYFTSGIDADIFKLCDVNGGEYALKKSRDNFFDNANDINQNDAALFRQEAAFAALLNTGSAKLQCPQTIYCDDDFLVMEFILDNDATVDGGAMIDMLGRLHRSTQGIELGFLPLCHEGYEDIKHALADRLLRRAQNLKAFLNVDFSWLNCGFIKEALAGEENENCLLHMDFRRTNLLNNAEGIFIIDWANALLGSPLLEIARLEVFAELGTGLLAKYLQQNQHIKFDQQAYNIYLLDTIIMMNLVFLSSAPNPEMAKPYETKLHNIVKVFCKS